MTSENQNIGCAWLARRYGIGDFARRVSSSLARGVFSLSHEGRSYSRRPISVLTAGSGGVNVLVWSQMHGNEPTSTAALMDAMDFLEQGTQSAREILSMLTLTVIPLLNPDGYARYDRRNAQGIDINRDARSLSSPEARLLMDTWERIRPAFALNLHDQEARYVSLNPPTETLLAMLAPECDEHKTVNVARLNAMKVIAGVASEVGGGRVARYDDVYTPTAFGDTFMSKGTSSILIEAGTAPGDKERTLPRGAMSRAIISALSIIASGSYAGIDPAGYDSLPTNLDFDGFDLLVKNVTVKGAYGDYKADIAIGRVKPTCNAEDFLDDFDDYRIKGIGDLGNAPALKTVDMGGCVLDGTGGALGVGRRPHFAMRRPDGGYTDISELLTKRY